MDAVLARTGAGHRVGADQVAVNVAWLRASASGVDENWERSFQQMLDFAGTKGWLTDDGGAVLAHIERRLTQPRNWSLFDRPPASTGRVISATLSGRIREELCDNNYDDGADSGPSVGS